MQSYRKSVGGGVLPTVRNVVTPHDYRDYIVSNQDLSDARSRKLRFKKAGDK